MVEPNRMAHEDIFDHDEIYQVDVEHPAYSGYMLALLTEYDDNTLRFYDANRERIWVFKDANLRTDGSILAHGKNGEMYVFKPLTIGLYNAHIKERMEIKTEVKTLKELFNLFHEGLIGYDARKNPMLPDRVKRESRG